MKRCWAGLAGLMFAVMAAATMAEAPVFKPVGTVRQIMLGIVAPTSDVIFKVPNQAPQGDQEWKTVQDSALTLAEAGNLLLLPGRAKDSGDWVKFSKQLITQGAKAFQAANARDAKSLEGIGNDIDDVCETCHAKYLRSRRHSSKKTPCNMVHRCNQSKPARRSESRSGSCFGWL